jgi:hypothetical protein
VHPVDVGLYLKDSFTFTTNCSPSPLGKKRYNNDQKTAIGNLENTQSHSNGPHSSELFQLKECDDSPVPDVKIPSITLTTAVVHCSGSSEPSSTVSKQ